MKTETYITYNMIKMRMHSNMFSLWGQAKHHYVFLTQEQNDIEKHARRIHGKRRLMANKELLFINGKYQDKIHDLSLKP